MIPDFMPVLSAGKHRDPSDGACAMEYVSVLAGEPFSDEPHCTHPILAAVARGTNDALADADRHLMVPLIGRLLGTPEVGTDLEQRVLSVRLAVWSARNVAHLVRDRDRALCAAAVDAAEAWADNPCRTTAAVCAAGAAGTYGAYSLERASAAQSATKAASLACLASFTATCAAYEAAARTAVGSASVGVQFLTGLLDEHARLTGHAAMIITDADCALLLAAVPQTVGA